MTSNLKMLFVGMGIMLMVLRPQVGLALMTTAVVGIEEAFTAMIDKKEPVEQPVNNSEIEELKEQIKALKQVEKKDILITELKEDNNSIKRKEYQKAVEMEEFLEEREQYHGTDPIVRKRLRLPPKLPSYEQWRSQ
jgi:uncharacterized protein YktB (UPF0637 family)